MLLKQSLCRFLSCGVVFLWATANAVAAPTLPSAQANRAMRSAAAVSYARQLWQTEIAFAGPTYYGNSVAAGLPTFSAGYYGALCNQTHDDAAAIQAAANAAVAFGGGTILLPAGHCKISVPISIDFSGNTEVGGIMVIGAGRPMYRVAGGTTIMPSYASGDVFIITQAGGANAIQFRDFGVKRDTLVTRATSGATFDFISHNSGIVIQNVATWADYDFIHMGCQGCGVSGEVDLDQVAAELMRHDAFVFVGSVGGLHINNALFTVDSSQTVAPSCFMTVDFTATTDLFDPFYMSNSNAAGFTCGYYQHASQGHTTDVYWNNVFLTSSGGSSQTNPAIDVLTSGVSSFNNVHITNSSIGGVAGAAVLLDGGGQTSTYFAGLAGIWIGQSDLSVFTANSYAVKVLNGASEVFLNGDMLQGAAGGVLASGSGNVHDISVTASRGGDFYDPGGANQTGPIVRLKPNAGASVKHITVAGNDFTNEAATTSAIDLDYSLGTIDQVAIYANNFGTAYHAIGNHAAISRESGGTLSNLDIGFNLGYCSGCPNDTAGNLGIPGTLYAGTAVSAPAGSASSCTGGFIFPNGIMMISGVGAPTCTAPKGSIYLRTDGAGGTQLYVSAGGGTWNPVAGV